MDGKGAEGVSETGRVGRGQDPNGPVPRRCWPRSWRKWPASRVVENVSAFGRTVLAVALGVTALTGAARVASRSSWAVTGTFSSLSYNSEGGDLLGLEIRVVRSRHGYQCTVQTAEGAPSDLQIADVRVAGDSVSFSVPGVDGGVRSFVGRVGRSSLTGIVRMTSGATDTVRLARRRSFWD